jgi:hypothetical protein
MKVAFRSPWRWPVFTGAVAALRWALRPFGRLEDRFIAWLVRQNNRRVLQHFQARTIASVLLIMPRCVKLAGCRVNVRRSPESPKSQDATGQQPLAPCLDCGDCQLSEVAKLTRQHEVRILVAYRSHIAYAMARKERPDLIIATACEDRLIKALRSVPEIPALLAPLAGMQRPCVNAVCDLGWLRDQLQLACHIPEPSLPLPAGSRAAGKKQAMPSAESPS